MRYQIMVSGKKAAVSHPFASTEHEYLQCAVIAAKLLLKSYREVQILIDFRLSYLPLVTLNDDGGIKYHEDQIEKHIAVTIAETKRQMAFPETQDPNVIDAWQKLQPLREAMLDYYPQVFRGELKMVKALL